MRLKLFFIHPQNYGNMMMADSFIYYFSELISQLGDNSVEFYLDVVEEDDMKIVKNNIPDNIVVKSDILFNQRRRGFLGKIEKLIYVPVEIMHTVKKFDACIVLGGDCISEYYSKQKFFFNMIKFHYISRKIPILALGQTMGPFSSFSSILVRWALKKCVIFSRDDNCYNYLKFNIGLKNIEKSRDLALLDIPFQNQKNIIKKTLIKYLGANDCKYVTFVPSGANLQYTTDTSHYVEEYVTMIKNTINKYSVDILLLAHVIHTETSNDSIIINRIMESMPNEYIKRIHCVNMLILPYEGRILLGNGLYTITGRMHAAVSSINMGVVPICLSYSVKYKGVIGDPYELNDYIIQCRGDDCWKGNRISSEIGRLQEKLRREIDNVIKRINEKNIENKKTAYSQIESTANFLVNV